MNMAEHRRAYDTTEPVEEPSEAEGAAPGATPAHGIIGARTGLRHTLAQAGLVAPTDSTVLIQGETGTGKEVIARFIHDASGRPGSFVQVNCSAIPAGLLESELFGHEKGAFTGAIASRIGRFELAHKGTLFLDEIGDLPLELQPKLLRALQEREIQRLGTTRTTHVDVRVVAATNQDLVQMVAEQAFRADLYYRLCVFPVRLPPLRQRSQDIPLLVRHFTEHFAQRMGRTIRTIPQPAMEAMTAYHWPGNVRELQNFVERAVILSRNDVLHFQIGELESLRKPPASKGTLQDVERSVIIRTLDQSRWVVGGRNGAAAALGLPRTTLISKMKKLGIVAPRAQSATAQA